MDLCPRCEATDIAYNRDRPKRITEVKCDGFGHAGSAVAHDRNVKQCTVRIPTSSEIRRSRELNAPSKTTLHYMDWDPHAQIVARPISHRKLDTGDYLANNQQWIVNMMQTLSRIGGFHQVLGCDATNENMVEKCQLM